jgi:hypothetical protein
VSCGPSPARPKTDSGASSKLQSRNLIKQSSSFLHLRSYLHPVHPILCIKSTVKAIKTSSFPQDLCTMPCMIGGAVPRAEYCADKRNGECCVSTLTREVWQVRQRRVKRDVGGLLMHCMNAEEGYGADFVLRGIVYGTGRER